MILLNFLIKNDFIDLDNKWQIKADILSWLTVALALIPEAIAFSFVAKVDPMVGLWAAFIMWLITSIFWWRPGMISWATGAMAVVMTSLVLEYSLDYLLVAVIFAWVFQILFWILKLWKIVRLIPHSVMIWFVNWLAIIILMAQFEQFKQNWEYIINSGLFIMIGLIILTMIIIHFLPKLTKIIPSWLVAIITITLLVIYFPWLENSWTVATYLKENWFNKLTWWFPNFYIPEILHNLNLEKTLNILKIILPYSAMLAVIWLTESLMTLTLIDELTETKWKTNKESIWQWLANLICWLFGSMWWCAMIWQSMININNNWRKRLSWISASIFLILFVVFWTNLIMKIPIAALVWLMFMVVIWTFAWPTFKMLNKIPITDAFVIISVTFITVITWDLAIAVITWIIISALTFAWKKSQEISFIKENKNNTTYYKLNWPLFFWSVTKFKSIFNIDKDKEEIIIDFANSRVMDHSAIEAINNLTDKYLKKWKKLHLKHLSYDCYTLIKNADKIVDINIIEDPKYFIS